MIKVSKNEWIDEISKSGFRFKYPVARSGKKGKYRYIVEEDYNNYIRYMKNKNRTGEK